ncbi:hypothetical protein Gogos_018154 [Gossypium gossypioides]|uniref:Uncharacterized protein n=1 Tax=Gossypium gossypioides TaxID=34282 RepID=A0A7J9BD18_GOSGO|nr:hypothetical protein [Gossypium gossypioides]
MQNSNDGGASDSRSDGDQNTKKVRFKEGIDGEVATMVVDSYLSSNLSWKDELLGGRAVIFGMACNDPSEGSESDFELLEGDVSTTMINGIPAIVFSDTISQCGDGLDPAIETPGIHRSQRDLRANDEVKTRKEPLGSKFMALNTVGEMRNGNGEADEGISGGKDKEKVNKALGGNKAKIKEMPKEGLSFSKGAGCGGSEGLKSSMGPAKPTSLGSTMTVNLGRKSSGLLEKIMGKRPMLAVGLGQDSLAQDNLTGDGLDFEVDGQGDMDSGVRANINFRNFEENKAHYNPTFEELEGIGVLITDGVLDLGKHSAVIF